MFFHLYLICIDNRKIISIYGHHMLCLRGVSVLVLRVFIILFHFRVIQYLNYRNLEHLYANKCKAYVTGETMEHCLLIVNVEILWQR